MSVKASSDFGLYKDIQIKKRTFSYKYILVSCVVSLVVLVILYTILRVSKNDDGITTKVVAEKLYNSDSRRDFIKAPSMPFKTVTHGPTPQHFTTTTEKITTLVYPQVARYRSRHYPKNIQDIISYVNRDNRKKEKIKEKQVNQASNQENYNLTTFGSSFLNNDPFYSYKPQDPSDINLLATADFRFAPPAWSNFKRTTPTFLKTSPSNIQSVENTYEDYTRRKPLVLTLNIYPEKNDLGPLFYSLRKRNIPYKITFGDLKQQKDKTMISLNLYQDSIKNENNDKRYIKYTNIF